MNSNIAVAGMLCLLVSVFALSAWIVIHSSNESEKDTRFVNVATGVLVVLFLVLFAVTVVFEEFSRRPVPQTQKREVSAGVVTPVAEETVSE